MPVPEGEEDDIWDGGDEVTLGGEDGCGVTVTIVPCVF